MTWKVKETFTTTGDNSYIRYKDNNGNSRFKKNGKFTSENSYNAAKGHVDYSADFGPNDVVEPETVDPVEQVILHPGNPDNDSDSYIAGPNISEYAPGYSEGDEIPQFEGHEIWKRFRHERSIKIISEEHPDKSFEEAFEFWEETIEMIEEADTIEEKDKIRHNRFGS